MCVVNSKTVLTYQIKTQGLNGNDPTETRGTSLLKCILSAETVAQFIAIQSNFWSGRSFGGVICLFHEKLILWGSVSNAIRPSSFLEKIFSIISTHFKWEGISCTFYINRLDESEFRFFFFPEEHDDIGRWRARNLLVSVCSLFKLAVLGSLLLPNWKSWGMCCFYYCNLSCWFCLCFGFAFLLSLLTLFILYFR